MTQSSWLGEVASSLKRLAAQSIAAESKLIINGIGLLRRAGSGKLDLPAISRTGASLFTEAAASYAKLQLDYASKIIDLGLSMSNRMASALDKNAAPAARPAAGPAFSFTLQLAGQPGDVCRSAFILESVGKNPAKVSFCHSDFGALSKAGHLSVPLRFDPAEIMLKADEQVRVTIEARIPGDAAAGRYEASGWIAGLTDTKFRVDLQVLGPAGV